ncbi:hypothetical protein [Prauserella rugosa]|uniref:hypothetical protein n=1 Tax=Prauserella rugosa TaxID=43354 RepID=UPI0004C434BF|nr:hypothetical protein [Prauserella rugosa]KMS91490.1 hypothetical protein ACZ91_09350 [Streptomyces regensis]
MPGSATDAVLLYLGTLGLIVEHLTLPDTLTPRQPDQLLDQLTKRILTHTDHDPHTTPDN